MLVLTRKPNEIIVITDTRTGERIDVIVVEVRGDQVRLGIAAPPHVSVDRAEVADRKREERRAA